MNLSSILFAASAAITCSTLLHAEGPSPEELVKRQCRSVHMHHMPIADKTKAIYVEAQANESAPGTYFCAANFHNGYIGFQEVADGTPVVIFSIWDPVPQGDNPHVVPEDQRALLIKKGDGVRTRRFGGEGTGGNSMRDFDWKVGDVLKFLVVDKEDGPGTRQLSGYVYNDKAKKWELISCWRTYADPKGLGYAVSFVEDFRRNYESTKHVRKATFGPAFSLQSDGQWLQASKNDFTGDGTPSKHVRAELNAARGMHSIATGGTLEADPAFPLFSSKELPASSKRSAPDKEVMDIIKAPVYQQEKYAE